MKHFSCTSLNFDSQNAEHLLTIERGEDRIHYFRTPDGRFIEVTEEVSHLYQEVDEETINLLQGD